MLRPKRFTMSMKFAAVEAITGAVDEPTPGRILPSPFDRSVVVNVAARVEEAARRTEVCYPGANC